MEAKRRLLLVAAATLSVALLGARAAHAWGLRPFGFGTGFAVPYVPPVYYGPPVYYAPPYAYAPYGYAPYAPPGLVVPYDCGPNYWRDRWCERGRVHGYTLR